LILIILCQEFEITSFIIPRNKAQENALNEIVSSVIRAINHDMDSQQRLKAFETVYELCRMAFERDIHQQTTLLLCQKALDMMRTGIEADAPAEFVVRSIIVSGIDANRLDNRLLSRQCIDALVHRLS
jgi:hypothetical protein